MLTREPSYYLQLIDLVKRNSQTCVTNIFLNAHEFSKILKNAFVFQLDKQAVFVFARSHYNYYDTFFICSSDIYKNLFETSSFLTFIKSLDLPIRVGLTGNMKKINNDSISFEKCGFIRKKTVGKVTSGTTVNKYAEYFYQTNNQNYSESCYSDSKLNDIIVAFPDVSEAKEIFEILCEEFDLIEDNIPEPEQIIKDIESRFVAVIKKDSKIIAISYNQIKNRIRSCIYEYVRKDFRAGGIMFSLNHFINKYFFEHENIIRTYGWRDVAKKRLINVYRALGETFTGIYTTYLIFNK